MTRKITFLMILAAMMSTVKAQWSLKPEIGIMLVNSENNYKWDNRFTTGLGAEYEWKAGNLDWGLQSGLYYTQRGFENYINRGYGAYGYNYNYNNNYGYYNINRGFIQLPVKLNLYIPICEDVRLVVGVGPYVGYSIHTSWGYGSYYYSTYPEGEYGNGNTTSYEDAWKNKPAIRKWDYGIGATVGLEIKRVILSASYDMSFGKEVKTQKGGLQYHNLTFTAGYRFKMGK
ncbi:MAG: PorT family protein [Tannerellaceae bacterium]|nr:PorT family protein [Tannerellaceae bacterium]